MPIFMKIRPLGAELFHADSLTDTDRQTAVTKLIVTFRNFANALNNGDFYWMNNSTSRLCWPESRCINLIHFFKMCCENDNDDN
jgi:hypothetical protein